MLILNCFKDRKKIKILLKVPNKSANKESKQILNSHNRTVIRREGGSGVIGTLIGGKQYIVRWDVVIDNNSKLLIYNIYRYIMMII